MSQQMWFSPGGERVWEALEAGFAWGERCHVVTERPSGRDADAFWGEVERHADKVSLGASSHGHFAWFEKGDELRFLLAPSPLSSRAIAGPGVWLYWAGNKLELPEGLQVVLESRVEPGKASAAAAAPTHYSRPIQSVCEVLNLRTPRDLFELEPEVQQLALWSTLLGEGPLDLDQAIRLAADRLRAQGFLKYQALRQAGGVYGGIEERLLAARRGTNLFDRPRKGFVRAIQTNLDELTAEQWRDCLISALERGVHVDRNEAVRLGFNYAVETYGIDAQRLRSGGRADHALRSAIKSAIRQGYLDRDGAAYLVRVVKTAPPTLRGVLEQSAESVAPAAEAAIVAPAAEPATVVPVGEPATVEIATETETKTEPTPEQAPEPEPVVSVSPLDRLLYELDFPTRAANWFTRQGLETVRDLVQWAPDTFAQERNVGRRTVRETRELLEAFLGCTWEEARAALGQGNEPVAAPAGQEESVDSATEALTAGGAQGWAHLAVSLSDEEKAMPLIDVELPARMKHFVEAEGLKSVGELLSLPHAALKSRDNLGSKSLNDTLDAIRDALTERAAPPAHATFLEAWQAHLSALEPIARMIVTRRAGMHGNRETLEELGSMLGITRERVRQIEARVLERFRERARWRRVVETNLEAGFGSSRALPLELLAEDPWWAGIERHELLLDYVVRRIFGDELFMVVAPSGKRYLAKFSPDAFAERLQAAKDRVAKLDYPIEMAAIEHILHSEAESLDPIVYGELLQPVQELLHRDPERPEIALGHGRYRGDEVVAFLNGQPEPVLVSVIEERFGRGALPEEVLYFKRGQVGLKRHFPDFDSWLERLVPAAIEVMGERPEGRQWLVPEIHEALREKGLLPEWLGHWHLASLLRVSGQVDYLGRLRVATRGSGNEERLLFEEALEQVLEEAGAPLAFQDLLTRVRARTDISETRAGLIVREAPFVRLDEQLIGLVERDIPGGPQTVVAAIEAVVAHLTQTQRGITPHQATVLVRGLSPLHATWSRQLVTSVLRNEASLRIDRSRNIGLDAWDDVRCPTRAGFIHREVEHAGGALSISELNALVESVYGSAPDRSSLGVLVREAGMEIHGDRVVRPAVTPVEAEEAPPPSRVGINLTGIPVELREMFEELVQRPLTDLSVLRSKVQEHVADIEHEHQINEFVDLEGARQLGQHCLELLERWDTLTSADRHLVHAAVSYFISWDDYESDLDIGGLDDDKQIVAAVRSYLGMEQLADGAAAS